MKQRSFSALERKGSRVFGGGREWQMVGVQGPLEGTGAAPGPHGRQYFQIETSSEETLLVFRRREERGMRELFLLAVLPGPATVAGSYGCFAR
jgi:hypothetical protein